MKIKAFMIVALFTSAFFQSQLASAQTTADKLSTALVTTNIIKLAYIEHWQSYLERPDSIDILGFSENDFQTDYIDHAEISPSSNAIIIGLSDEHFGDKQWAALIPEIANDQIVRWRCQTTVAQDLVGQTGCSGGYSYQAIDTLLNANLFSDMLRVLTAVRTNYAESYYATGVIPTSMNDLGVDATLLNLANASHLMVEPETNAIIVGLNNLYGSNQWVSLVPIIGRHGYIARWSCRTTLPRELVEVSCGAETPVEDILYSVRSRRVVR